MPNSKTKKLIVKEARRFVAQKFPETKGSEAICLYLAVGVIAAAARRGIRLVPQAGTCYWPRLTEDLDDGVEDTHFGYEWDPESKLSKLAIGYGGLPEMHVWAGDPVTQEVVDLATKFFPAQCKKMIGADWKAPEPPEFCWVPLKDLPEGVVYSPNEEATKYAVDTFSRIADGRRFNIARKRKQ